MTLETTLASFASLVMFCVPAFADRPETDASTQVSLDKNLLANLPPQFKLQKIADTPLSYVAVGPSPDSSGKKRPAILFFISPRIDPQKQKAFLTNAKQAARNAMKRFRIQANSWVDNKKQKGIEGADMTATNAEGKSWWAVRTLHTTEHSVQIIVGTFEKQSFDQLTEMIADGKIIRN